MADRRIPIVSEYHQQHPGLGRRLSGLFRFPPTVTRGRPGGGWKRAICGAISARLGTEVLGANAMDPGSEPDTHELLRWARNDPNKALGPLLERYRHYLLLLARLQIGQRLQGKVDASDIVQEVFLEAHRHFHGFRGSEDGQLACWLRQILAARLAKLVRRYLRAQGRNVRLERELAVDIDRSSQMLDRGLMAPQSSPSKQASRREQGVQLAEALGRLPEHYREVLILRHLEELTFPEIAGRLGRSLDSVKNLWARALSQLRDVLGAGL